MSKIDIDKFVASLLKAHEGWNEWAIDSEDIKKALADQHLEYKDGEIVSTVYVSGNYSLSISNTKLGTITGGGTYTIPIEPQSNEMQGEQKPFDYESANIQQKDFAPKQEPKFKVGDYIVYDYCMGRVVEITNDAYLLDIGQGIPFSCEDNVHLWTIQDAKDGDVLVDSYGNVCIYQEPSTNLMYHSRFYANNKGFYDLGGSHAISNTYPATKGQRDLLFQKMKEAGYEWDAEKKELKIVDWSKHIKYEPNSPSIVEQKQEWSEEDEKMFDFFCAYLNNTQTDWLKSLKDRIKGKEE